MIRVIAVDARGRELLVYEAHQLIAPASAFQVRNACRETCVLESLVPSALSIELVDASLVLDAIVVNESGGGRATRARALEARAQRETIKAAQEREIIRVLNRRIKARGLKWIAGLRSLACCDAAVGILRHEAPLPKKSHERACFSAHLRAVKWRRR